MKFFDNELKITKSTAKKLFKGESVKFKLKYKGKDYEEELKVKDIGKFYLVLDK